MDDKKTKRPNNPKEKKPGYVFYNHRRATPAIFMGIVIVLCALILLGLVLGIRGSVKLKSVKIDGETKYTSEELLAAAQISLGSKIYKIDLGKAESKLLDGCPYLLDVDLKREMGGRLKIKVRESAPKYYLLSGSGAFVLDGDFRLLEISEEAQKWNDSGLIRISGSNLSYTKLGAPIKFGGESSLDRDNVSEILRYIEAFKYAADVDFVCFDDRYSIYFTCGEKFKVVLGDRFDISEKLKTAGKMMDTYESSSDIGLVVNVFDLSAPFVGSR